MKVPYYPLPGFPEVPFQENRPQADDPAYGEPGPKAARAVLVLIAIGLAGAYIVSSP